MEKPVEILIQTGIIALKELRYAFRDSHVLIYTFLFPVLIYPISMLAMSEYSLWRIGLTEKNPYRVVIIEPDSKRGSVQELEELIEKNNSFKLQKTVADSDELKKYLAAVKKGELHLLLDASQGAENIKAYINPSDDRATELALQVRMLAMSATQRSLKKNLSARGYAENFVPLSIRTRNISPLAGDSSKRRKDNEELELTNSVIVCTGLFAYLTLIYTMASIYPALCAFTEETEKKTKKSTFMLPVDHGKIVFGKYLAITTITLMATAINVASLLSMGFYFYTKMAFLRQITGYLQETLSMTGILAICLGLIASILLLCSIFSLLAAQAKSFKEAQNLSSLVLFAIMILPLVALIPDLELGWQTVFVPFLNSILLCKSVISHGESPAMMPLICLEALLLSYILLRATAVVFWDSGDSRIPIFAIGQNLVNNNKANQDT